MLGGISDSSKALMAGLIGGVSGGSGAPQVQVYEPAEPIPADVPLPPRRPDADKALKMAAKTDADVQQ